MAMHTLIHFIDRSIYEHIQDTKKAIVGETSETE